jgi:hypothetical protein
MRRGFEDVLSGVLKETIFKPLKMKTLWLVIHQNRFKNRAVVTSVIGDLDDFAVSTYYSY